MKIAMLFKTKQIADKVILSVKNVQDGVEYYPYTSVDSLIKESDQRRLYFDRIIMSESAVKEPEGELGRLSRYVSEESDRTLIIFVSPTYKSEGIRVFQELFNSPLYAPVVLRTTTIKDLECLLTNDISELKIKYFDENKVDSGSTEPERRQSQKSGSLFGRKNRENHESSSYNQEDKKDGENSGTAFSNSNQEITSVNSVPKDSKVGLSILSDDATYSDSEQDYFGNENALSTPDTDSKNIENGLGGLGSDFMSLGNTPSDTGFLEDDDDKEEEGENEKTEPDEDLEGSLRGRGGEDNSRSSELNLEDMSKVIFYIGERGVGVTSFITDLALDLYDAGESVLIMDLDSKRNGILANIDVRDFYARGKEDGIDTRNPYQDDEVDILSNGYSMDISKNSVRNVFRDRDFIDNYDRVLVDCPLDCLSSLAGDVVKNCSVVVIIKGDRLSLTATSIGLTSKSIDSTLERYIADNCKVCVMSYANTFDDDVDFVRNTFLFSNGNWLNRID